MKNRDDFFLAFLIFMPLIIIFNVFLTACSPFEIKETEKITEELIKDIVQEETKS